jgi:hypothetical protein
MAGMGKMDYWGRDARLVHRFNSLCPMSEKTRQSITTWSPIVLWAAAAIWACAAFPGRVAALEKRATDIESKEAGLEQKLAQDHELLSRMDERTKAIKELLERQRQ